ncbi:MAG: hypothetical protein K8I60_17425 [Anaerolineae bacterium]|nr:hypothetical protein [Anaerolineae bacterium]
MRSLEVVTVVLLALAWLSYLIPASRRPRWLLAIPALPAVAALIQIVVEQYRWQMVPAYALAALLLVLSLRSLRQKEIPAAAPAGCRRWILRAGVMALGLVVLLIAAGLPLLFPMFSPAAPTGPYPVGTTTLEMVDDSRPEVYPPDTTAHRDLVVQVWYPAAPEAGAAYRPYVVDNTGAFLAGTLSMPGFMFDYMRLLPSHSYQDAPLADSPSPYPVLVFSHGFSGLINQNSVQMEELASHGYIVFSIGHPYAAMGVIYPDGRTVPANPTDPNPFLPQYPPDFTDIIQGCKAETDPAQIKACWQRVSVETPNIGDVMLDWTADTRFVMDELERINAGDITTPFAGRLDLDTMGVFGHSLGGATAVQVCLEDDRCRAVVDMDGMLFGNAYNQVIQQPFMLMNSNDGTGTVVFAYAEAENDAYRIAVATAAHLNYTDMSLYFPPAVASKIGLLGTIDAQRIETIMNRYLVAFFDRYLLGKDSPLLEAADPDFPEVDFQRR